MITDDDYYVEPRNIDNLTCLVEKCTSMAFTSIKKLIRNY